MKRKKILLIEILMCFLLMSVLIAAQGEVCCEQTKAGAWCENVPESGCKLDYRSAPTSCDETYYCELVTCIDTDKGTCMPTRRTICENTGGVPDERDKDDIPMCQNGCCLIGEEVAFVTQTECKQLADDYGIDVHFRGDVKDQEVCFALASPKEKGACVYEKDYITYCEITARKDCDNPDARFYEGLLCTASGISDCAKSRNTRCENDKVYFVDACKNLANVYDENMYTRNENEWTKEMEDYWTYIQEPNCSVFGADETCGNCMYRLGSICRKYKAGDGGMPTNASKYGNYVCRDLGCYKGNTKIAEHGESWCAESEGTYFHIPETIDDDTKAEIENETRYNLPGSRYYKLLCWDGEVITYPCKDYRQEICKETEIIEDYTTATCKINRWRFCYEIANKEECEDISNDCKWIRGYRFDREIADDADSQGSCVPLYSPGFEFWEGESESQAICASGTIIDLTVYETHWTTTRDKFKDVNTKDAAERCLENCYLIPDYSSDLTLSQITNLYNGLELPDKVKEYYVSRRRGHYCTKKDDPEKKKLGKVIGSKVSCASNEDKRRVPLFYRHSQWLNFVRKRARSMGDCGFTDSFIGEEGQPGSELITAIFQELDQQGNIKSNATVETIYIGNDRIFDEYREND